MKPNYCILSAAAETPPIPNYSTAFLNAPLSPTRRILAFSITEWPNIKPNANDVVTRAGAAWFIWHLYAEARANRGMLSRYSARYATGANPRSPITDIPPLSPFFDSILGCVETELMSLPDGRNFQPTYPIRGAELLTILKKINN